MFCNNNYYFYYSQERESPVRFNIQHWFQILAGFIAYVKTVKVTHGNEASYYYDYLPERESPVRFNILGDGDWDE